MQYPRTAGKFEKSSQGLDRAFAHLESVPEGLVDDLWRREPDGVVAQGDYYGSGLGLGGERNAQAERELGTLLYGKENPQIWSALGDSLGTRDRADLV